MTALPIFSMQVTSHDDILVARQKSRQIASALQFDSQDQTRIAAAVSEIVREICTHAEGGTIEVAVENGSPCSLVLTVRPNNATEFIRHVDSSAESSIGLINARRLMDQFSVEGSAQKPHVVFRKRVGGRLQWKHLDESMPKRIEALQADAAAEIRDLSDELLKTIEALRKRQEDLARLNAELEETNRGVVALYAELDEKAEQLKRADELKSQFLSHMSHEFRTPLNSIIGLARLLLDHVDGPLSSEQEKQVRYIDAAARGLTDLVNDLLDLAKIAAGKSEVHAANFYPTSLFSTLRGMFRPLQTNTDVVLTFDDVSRLPPLFSDEGKISQILRNYISNALKFTEAGTVCVSAQHIPEKESIVFSVADTGIGIPPEHQHLLFREFSQLDSHLQKKTKGTGLGLALCRKLAEQLGGSVSVQSKQGKGSTFFATVPIQYGAASAHDGSSPSKLRSVLIIDDDQVWRYLMRAWFPVAQFTVFEAGEAGTAMRIARDHELDLIVLDLNLPGINGFEFLQDIKKDIQLASIPVVVSTSRVLENEEREFLDQSASGVLSKEGLTREYALDLIGRLLN